MPKGKKPRSTPAPHAAPARPGPEATRRLLVRNIGHLVTMDASRRVLRNAWVLAEDGWVRKVG